MKSAAIRLLLAALNSRWLNSSPCKYGYIGNVDAFDIGNLRSEVRQRPDLTVAQLIAEAEQFKACPMTPGTGGVTVLEDGVPRPADVWDIYELGRSLAPPAKTERES
jgi:hypothetical protein